jgi:aspartate/tyrosine/aromatic aminotransferase
LGLYQERIGALHFVTSGSKVAERVRSQVKLNIRAMYSNPPAHGARIVAKVLGSPSMMRDWMQELT